MKRAPEKKAGKSGATRPAGKKASSRPPDADEAPAIVPVIRPAQRSDIAAVTRLDAQITGINKGKHWQDLYEQKSKAGQPAGVFLVAVAPDAKEQLLGFIVGEIRAWEFGSTPCGWVYAMSVSPDARLQGVAAALLDTLAATFRKAGVHKMRTMVARDNPLPLLFFRGEGMMAGPYIQLEKDLL